MEDKEKVIEQCKQAIDSGEPVMDYHFYYRVIELLKEQEPVSPIRMHHTEHKQTDNYKCGKCGGDMYFEQRFCDFCGQAAKWD